MAAPFNDSQQTTFDTKVAELLTHYPPERKQAAMMPVLRLLQELVGWLPPEGMDQVASKLGVHPSKVLEVATFYVMFHTHKPGKYVIDVCTNLACALQRRRGNAQVHRRQRCTLTAGREQRRRPVDRPA